MRTQNILKSIVAFGVFAATLFNLNLNLDSRKTNVLDIVSLTATTASAACSETKTGYAGRCNNGTCSQQATQGSYCTL